MKTVSKDGTKIIYDKVGSGPLVIIVSGAMVTRAYVGHKQLSDLLAPHFTVINYDRRGRGESDDKTDPNTYKVEREVEDIQALINAEKADSAMLIGFSSGGALSLKAALDGAKINKVAIYETPFMVGDDKTNIDHVTPLKEFILNKQPEKAAKYFMKQIFGMPSIAIALMHLTPYWSRSVEAAPTLPYDLAIMRDYEDPETFAKVTVPVLVMAGEKTQPRLMRGAKAAVKAIPYTQFKTLPGQSHMVSMKLLAPHLDAFFSEK